MAYELTPEDNLRTDRRRWIEILLLLGFFLSLLIGLGALAGLYWLGSTESETSITADPFQELEPDRIPPDLALLQLTGAQPSALARQATNAGQRALAYAIIQFDPKLPASERAGQLLLLGRRYQNAEGPDGAAQVYATARTVALLATTLSPLERGQVLVQSAQGLLRAGEINAAVGTAIQAQHVAAQAPALLPAQRDQLWRDVEPLLRTHGTAEQLRQLTELLRSPVPASERVPLVSRWPQLSQPAPLPPPLADIVAVRRQAAQRLVDRIGATRGMDIEPEREALRQALLEENRIRSETTRQQLASGLTLTQQHWLLQEERAWIALKLRIASGGLGLRLVPAWEENPAAIRTELGVATTDLVSILNAQIEAQEEPVARQMLQVEVLRWLVLQSALGFYPDGPLGELVEQLDAAQAELDREGYPLALPVGYDAGATPPGFRIIKTY